MESALDDETEAFLENCNQKADAVFSQIGHLLFKGIFGYIFSVTTVNGWVFVTYIKSVVLCL